MSQKKVDKYKNSKYSRNSALKKEREGSQCEGGYCDGYFCIDRLYFRIIFRQCRIENTYEMRSSRDVLKHLGDFLYIG